MARLLKYIAILGITIATVSVVAVVIAARSVGTQAYVAGIVAALVVWVASSLALLIAYKQSIHANKDTVVTSALMAMLVRMALPIGAVVVVGQVSRPLMEAGFFGLLTVNYLFALALEIVLSLRLTKKTPTVSPPTTTPPTSP